MVTVNLWLAIAAFVVLQSSQVHAAGFGSDPVAVDPSKPQFLDGNSPLRGSPLRRPQEFAVIRNGQLLIMNGTKVVREEAMLQDAETGLQNTDLQYLAQVLNTQFNYNSDQIQSQWASGQSDRVAWPGSYWPSYIDGINTRWSGGPSAAEKYAMATGRDVGSFMDAVSAHSGVDAYSGWQGCQSKWDCPDGSECGIREGRWSGYCIPAWAGICHGWAPAAMLEYEPRCPVNYNGVIFEPFDIKGLYSQIYDEAGIGVRYVGVLVGGGDYDDTLDQYGRYVSLARRDIGPAAFHIVCANVMGRDRNNFLVDVDAGPQVWNQPARSYDMSGFYAMNPDDAARAYLNSDSYSNFNPEAVTVMYMQNNFRYINEAYDNGPLVPSIDQYTATRTYEYLLELDGNNNIIGGEWVGNSRYDHPDIVWVPLNRPGDGYVSPLGLEYNTISYMNWMSVFGDC